MKSWKTKIHAAWVCGMETTVVPRWPPILLLIHCFAKINAPRNTPGTALCDATLRLLEVKSHNRIIWCVIQREHIVENRCD